MKLKCQNVFIMTIIFAAGNLSIQLQSLQGHGLSQCHGLDSTHSCSRTSWQRETNPPTGLVTRQTGAVRTAIGIIALISVLSYLHQKLLR